ATLAADATEHAALSGAPHCCAPCRMSATTPHSGRHARTRVARDRLAIRTTLLTGSKPELSTDARSLAVTLEGWSQSSWRGVLAASIDAPVMHIGRELAMLLVSDLVKALAAKKAEAPTDSGVLPPNLVGNP